VLVGNEFDEICCFVVIAGRDVTLNYEELQSRALHATQLAWRWCFRSPPLELSFGVVAI
jgi:hypothetical protein